MEKISRTQKKKAAEALQKKGEQLVNLSDADFHLLEIPDELKEALAMARKLTRHEARRRQLQYIGRLMREIDGKLIDDALQKIVSHEDAKGRQFKIVERWRDELVGGGDERWRWLLENYADIDKPQLERLILNARGLSSQQSPKRAARMLFKLLSRLEIKPDSID